jgi:hypothetical protein
MPFNSELVHDKRSYQGSVLKAQRILPLLNKTTLRSALALNWDSGGKQIASNVEKSHVVFSQITVSNSTS